LSVEAEQLTGGKVVVWHPDVTRQLIESAADRPVVEIKAQTSAEALTAWRSAETGRNGGA
jgi:hypothetical protein